ncbi:microviridin/marinostatin family tricyclic proteinase inhibitor [Shewanella sp. 10N.286.54.B9]|uniref:microviridin/marinostatin family tricyclic proteinase inhibitor n=1 Tax=Shewanella sp. 10N.286.54.B9 TaxID=3229719 RepID=UPI00354CF495
MNKPFFSNFLEEQDLKKVTGGIVAGDGGCVITDKRKDELEHTMKHPSDGDEGGELESM